MSKDSTDLEPPVQDPSVDSPGGQADEEPANSPQAQPPTDLEARLAAAEKRATDNQAWATREAQQRARWENEVLTLRQQQAQPVDPADPLAADRAALERERQQLRREQEMAAIQREYPPEIVEAWQATQRYGQLDPSPRGAIEGFIQGIVTVAQRQAEKAQQAPPAPAPTKTTPETRGVDTSRSEAPDPGFDQKIAGAKANHDLRAHVSGILDKWNAGRS